MSIWFIVYAETWSDLSTSTQQAFSASRTNNHINIPICQCIQQHQPGQKEPRKDSFPDKRSCPYLAKYQHFLAKKTKGRLQHARDPQLCCNCLSRLSIISLPQTCRLSINSDLQDSWMQHAGHLDATETCSELSTGTQQAFSASRPNNHINIPICQCIQQHQPGQKKPRKDFFSDKRSCPYLGKYQHFLAKKPKGRLQQARVPQLCCNCLSRLSIISLPQTCRLSINSDLQDSWMQQEAPHSTASQQQLQLKHFDSTPGHYNWSR